MPHKYKCPVFRRTTTKALRNDVILHSALRARYFRRYRRCSELRAIAAAYDEQTKCAYNRRMPITHGIVEAIRKKMKTLK
jgi:hypothetical protein